jgi:hypothetical protein
MEARVGIEPTIEDLQSSALPLGDRAISNQFGKKEAVSTQDQVNSAQNAHFLVLHCQLGIFFNYWTLPSVLELCPDRHKEAPATPPIHSKVDRLSSFQTWLNCSRRSKICPIRKSGRK